VRGKKEEKTYLVGWKRAFLFGDFLLKVFPSKKALSVP